MQIWPIYAGFAQLISRLARPPAGDIPMKFYPDQSPRAAAPKQLTDRFVPPPPASWLRIMDDAAPASAGAARASSLLGASMHSAAAPLPAAPPPLMDAPSPQPAAEPPQTAPSSKPAEEPRAEGPEPKPAKAPSSAMEISNRIAAARSALQQDRDQAGRDT